MGDDARDAATIRQGDDDRWVSGTTSSGSSSLFSSTSSLTDDDQADDATSSGSPPGCRRPPVSSSLTSSDHQMQMDGATAVAVGPPYELSAMLDHLPPLRTGLSEYYRGRSQSFTSLADVGCVEDLAKKIAPSYIGRRTTKASRCYAAALGAKNQLSKKVAKKVPRNTGLLRSSSSSSNRPPTYHGKRE